MVDARHLAKIGSNQFIVAYSKNERDWTELPKVNKNGSNVYPLPSNSSGTGFVGILNDDRVLFSDRIAITK